MSSSIYDFLNGLHDIVTNTKKLSGFIGVTFFTGLTVANPCFFEGGIIFEESREIENFGANDLTDGSTPKLDDECPRTNRR
jgi:hypothetical protein